jgi:hypothetical protein
MLERRRRRRTTIGSCHWAAERDGCEQHNEFEEVVEEEE